MGIRSFIGMLFGANAAVPPDAKKLDGTTDLKPLWIMVCRCVASPARQCC